MATRLRRWMVGGWVGLASASAGCGPSTAGEGDDGSGDGGGGEVARRCRDVEPSPLAPLASHAWTRSTGACGHVVLERSMAGGWELVHDDAHTLEALGSIASPVFAATGHLLAFADDDALVLRDLEDDTRTRMGARPRSFGFVASADAARGVWLYSCTGGTLVRHDGADATTELASDVACDLIATGGRSLVTVDARDRLVVVDADAARVRITDRTAHPAHRDHALVVSSDGALALHHVSEPSECDDDCDHQFAETVEIAAVDLRSGEVVAQVVGKAATLALVGRAGHLLRGDDGEDSFVQDDGVRMDIGDHDGWVLSGDGRAAFIIRDGAPDRVERLDVASGMLTTIAELDQITRVHVGEGDDRVAIEHATDACGELDDDGGCRRGIRALRLWQADLGLGEPLVRGIAMEPEALLGDGRVLVTGELWQQGALVRASAWVDHSGAVLEQWSWAGAGPSAGAVAIGPTGAGFVFAVGEHATRQLRVLGDGGESRAVGPVGEIGAMTVLADRAALVGAIDQTIWGGAIDD